MGRFSAAIDLGTTTVEVSLLREDGSVIAKHGFLNPQMKFGSDVISRMTFLAKNPENDELRELLKSGFREALTKMLSWQNASFPVDLSKIIVTGNTVMAAILLNVSTEPMGMFPFGMPMSHTGEFSLDGVPAYVPVGASAFLGSDSCGGAWVLPLREDELLMDLGTNGEMILLHDGKWHGATAACGPAFENCTRAQGIYGSTTLSVISKLLKMGKLPKDGTLPEEIAKYGIYEDGTIPKEGDSSEEPAGARKKKMKITPKILHEVTLASAAVYATFSMLLKRAGMRQEDLKQIYLAGGFGFHLSLRDAGIIGLIPESLLPKVKIVGNTSLLAAEKMAQSGIDEYDSFRQHIVTHQLAGDPDYEGIFYSSMSLRSR